MLAPHPLDENLQRSNIAAGADEHAFGVVQDEARQAEVSRMTPNHGPEADALDASAHADLERRNRGGRAPIEHGEPIGYVQGGVRRVVGRSLRGEYKDGVVTIHTTLFRLA